MRATHRRILRKFQRQAVVALASFRAGDRYWRPLQGHLHTADGRITDSSPFRRRFDHRDLAPTSHDSTAREITKLAASLGSRLPITDPDLTEAIDALHWWQDAEAQSPLVAVVLDVRVLELLAARIANTKWYKYVETCFAAAWVRRQIDDALLEAVFQAVDNYAYEPAIDPSDHDALEAIRTRMYRDPSSDQAVAALPTLAAIYPVHSRTGRRIHTLVGQLSSTAALDAWCGALDDRWTRALERLRRTRNALAHAGPLVPASADTVHTYVRCLAGTAVAWTLEGLLNGRSPKAAHNGFRGSACAWRAGVPNATSVHEALSSP